ncbi:MAG: MFS transporter [Chloroflexi bacterium]|nr:MFS transporter [Chloroflexota bacterium]
MIAKSNRADLLMVGIAFAGFTLLGVPGTLLNIAWTPYMRTEFGLSLDAVGTLLVASTVGYFFASSTSGRIITRLGIGRMLLVSALVSAVGLLGWALTPGWLPLIGFSLLSGVGAGLIDGGMNIYFAATYGPRLMNWLHACFGVGATLGPVLMNLIVNNNQSWRWGYAVVATLYGVMAVTFFLVRHRWQTAQPSAQAETVHRPRQRGRDILLLPAVWLGVVMFFIYAGLEVTGGQWSYTLFTEARGVTPEVAGGWVSLYWGSFTIGRFLFGAFANRLRMALVIRLCMIGAIIGAVLIWWSPVVAVGFFGLALLGFVQAPIFPLLVGNTQERLGPTLAPHAIGLQIAAASVGIAALPGLVGVLAQNIGVNIIAPFMVVVTIFMLVLYEISQRSAQAVRQPEPVPAAK